MKSVFSKHFSSFLLHWWPWLKIVFYIFYFFFIQMSNSVESSFARFFVNTLFFIVAIGIIEIGLYCLQQVFRRRRYKNAVLTFLGSYIALAIAGYYILHGNQNFVATEIWNREFEASWRTFLLNFNQFYWAFFKYAMILFLIKQMVLLLRLLKVRERANLAIFPETAPTLSDWSFPVNNTNDIVVESLISPAIEQDQPVRLFDNAHKVTFKVGLVTYMLDIDAVVFLEVYDDITTIYRTDGSCFKVKVSLTQLCEWLPKDRIVRIHDSRAVALRYIFREAKGHIYMNFYEDRPLKLGDQKKYRLYKKWKEHNLMK